MGFFIVKIGGFYSKNRFLKVLRVFIVKIGVFEVKNGVFVGF
jgi:hypothetical protein